VDPLNKEFCPDAGFVVGGRVENKTDFDSCIVDKVNHSDKYRTRHLAVDADSMKKKCNPDVGTDFGPKNIPVRILPVRRFVLENVVMVMVRDIDILVRILPVHLLVLEDVVMVVVEKDVVVVAGKDVVVVVVVVVVVDVVVVVGKYVVVVVVVGKDVVVVVVVGSLEFYWHSRNRVLYFVAKTWVMVVLVVVVACDGYRSCCGW
jgi:hypothetical protein